jgi:hypothetical protein
VDTILGLDKQGLGVDARRYHLAKLMMSPKWRSQQIALKHEGQAMQTSQPKVR